jgi:hypothetical protein
LQRVVAEAVVDVDEEWGRRAYHRRIIVREAVAIPQGQKELRLGLEV